jgi:hypothetical protein
MLLSQKGNILIITQEKAKAVELVKKIHSLYPKFKNNNIIVNLTSLGAIKKEDISEFLDVSNIHRATKHSFVIVTDKIDLENSLDEIIVVPTLKEAYDIIEMEEMERDLGF